MTQRLTQFSFSFCTAFVGVTLLWPVSLYAYFGDVEIAPGALTAGQLTIEAGLEESSKLFVYFTPTFSSQFGVTYDEENVTGELTFITSTIGDSDFCNSLSIEVPDVSLAGPAPSTSVVSIEPQTGLTTYEFEVALDTSSAVTHGVGCDMALTINGYQENVPATVGGFRDSETLTWQFIASTIVLNEVLADPATGQKEFIELFNNGSTPVDVAGWTISELSGGSEVLRTIVSGGGTAGDLEAYDGSGTTVVPAGGHLALSFVGSASYLNNDGDTVTLRDASATILDSYTYTSSLDGKSDARIPDGIGAWIDPIPTPGGVNRLESSLASLSIELASASTSASSTDKDKSETEQETKSDGNSGGSNSVEEDSELSTATSSSDTASSTEKESPVATGTTTDSVASSSDTHESAEVIEETASSIKEVSNKEVEVIEKEEDTDESAQPIETDQKLDETQTETTKIDEEETETEPVNDESEEESTVEVPEPEVKEEDSEPEVKEPVKEPEPLPAENNEETV